MTEISTIGKKRSRSPVAFGQWKYYRLTDLMDWFVMPEYQQTLLTKCCEARQNSNCKLIGGEILIQGAEFVNRCRDLSQRFEAARQLQELTTWAEKEQVSQ